MASTSHSVSSRPSVYGSEQSIGILYNPDHIMLDGGFLDRKRYHTVELRRAQGLETTLEPGTPLADVDAIFQDIVAKIQNSPKAASSALKPTTTIREQLTDCAAFCEELKKDTQEKIKQSSELHLTSLHPLEKQARETEAKLLFVLDKNPAFAEKLAQAVTLGAKVELIRKEFDTMIKAEKAAFDQLVKTETDLKTSDIQRLQSAQLAKCVAALLVTSKGYLNLELADVITQTFFAKGETPAQREITRVLEAYKKDPSLLAQFNAVKAPVSKESPAWTLIAATCSLPSDAKLEDSHAKRAFLSAQLSYFSIEKENVSCGYALTIAGQIKHLRLDTCGQDFASLLAHGALRRSVAGSEKTYSVRLSRLADNFLDQPLKVNKDGSLYAASKRKVWELASVKRASQAMGKSDADLKAQVNTLIAGKKYAEINPRELIARLVANDAKLIERGQLAYCAVHYNPLLTAWEETLTAIAQDRPALAMRAKILSSVKTALLDQFKAERVDAGFSKKDIAEFMKVFLKRVNDQIDIEYDADSAHFVIRNVADADAFKELLIRNAKAEYFTKLDEVSPLLVAGRAEAYINEDEFIASVQQLFGDTPWNAALGNDPVEFYQTYSGEVSGPVEFAQAANAKELLQQLSAFAEKNARPDTRIELAVPQHAVSLTLKTGEGNWLKEYFAKLNKENFNVPLTAEQRNKIVEWVEEELIPDVVVIEGQDGQEDVTCLSLFRELDIPADLPLNKFVEEIYKAAMQYAGAGLEGKETVSDAYKQEARQRLTSFVMQETLPPVVQSYVIPFADITMAGEEELCFYPDLVTKEVRIGLLSRENQTLRPFDEEATFFNQPLALSVTRA